MITGEARFRTPVGGMLAAAVLTAAMAGCTPFPGFGPPPALYDLQPRTEFNLAMESVDWQLLVEVPAATAGIDTARVALRSSPAQIEHFAGRQWIDRAPIIVQSQLVQAFEDTGRIVSVGRDTIGLRGDFMLKTDLREFFAAYSPDDPNAVPVARVRLHAKLVRLPRRDIVASRNFESAVTASSRSFDDIVVAFEAALGPVLSDIAEWTLREGQLASADQRSDDDRRPRR